MDDNRYFCATCGVFERESELFYEKCPECGISCATTDRPSSYFVRFTPYFDQAFGKMVKSPKEKRKLLKEHGLIEVGGEFSRHIQGKNLASRRKSSVTTQEVAEKLREIEARNGTRSD